MFRCPSCNEVLTLGQTACRYCSIPISQDRALAAAAQFETVSKAVSQANNLKFGNIAALLFIGIQTFLCLTYDQTSPRFFIVQAAPVIALVTLLIWFFKYGTLQTKDPDYPEAKAAIKKSLLVWGATLIVQIGLLSVLFWRLWQRNM
jgi:hypothetical protein